MIDIYFFINFFLSVALVICFAIILVVQLMNYKQVKSNFFTLSMFFGFISSVLWLVNITSYQIEPNDLLRVLLESSLHVTFTVVFYFLYRHFNYIYSSVITTRHKFTLILLTILVILSPIVYVSHYLGLFPYKLIYDLVQAGYLPAYVGPHYFGPGSDFVHNFIITTYLSHIQQFTACYVTIFLLYQNYKYKLVKFKVINNLEFFSLLLLAIAYVIIFVENILLSSAIFPYSPTYEFLIGPIFLILIGWICLTANYIGKYPRHILYPQEVLDSEEFKKYIQSISNIIVNK